MKVFFFGLIGLGVSGPFVAGGLSPGGECLPPGPTSVEVVYPTPGEEAGAILMAIAFLTGPAGVIPISVGLVRLPAGLSDRISPWVRAVLAPTVS